MRFGRHAGRVHPDHGRQVLTAAALTGGIRLIPWAQGLALSLNASALYAASAGMRVALVEMAIGAGRQSGGER